MSHRKKEIINDICVQLGIDPKCPPSHLTPKEFSAIGHVTVETLATWRTLGRYSIPYTKMGSKILYPLNGVAKYLADNEVTHTGMAA